MARVKLEIPNHFHFKTEIPIRITDINYGGHLGNDSLLSILQEARVQFLKSINATETDFFGAAMIMSDMAIVYKGEGFYDDVLIVEIGITEITRVSFEMYYKVTEQKSNREIAQAKTGMVCFDYKNRKVVSVPVEFKNLFV